MDKKICISYDHQADVMYLSFDESAKAEAEEIEDGVFARYESKTHALVGLTITNFSRKFGMELKEVVVPIYA